MTVVYEQVNSKQCANLLQSLALIKIDTDEAAFILNTGLSTTFLTPPIEACINEMCSMYAESKSLQYHHDSVTVTVYTLNGAQPAIKQALKCKGCSCIYNYSMYGNKTGGGKLRLISSCT